MATMRSCLLVALLVGFVGLAPELGQSADDPGAYHRFVLTSARRNKRVGAFRLSGADLPGVAGRWSVRQIPLHGGRQEGCELIRLDNGRLRITVVPTRGLSVLDVRMGDLRLGWDSPVKEVVHPQFINLMSRGGLGWLEGFNEWMVRCGLEYAGQAGPDEFIDNTGKKSEMSLTLHGRIANIPASEVEVRIDRRPPHRLRLRGTVHERQFYGPKLALTTEISTELGSDSFRIVDAVENRGAADQEFTVIYHANYGPPLLEKGSRVVAPVKKLTPFNDTAAKGVEEWAVYRGPTPGFIEQGYFIEPRADAAGRTVVLLKNAAGDKGTSIRWSVKELPYMTLWKNTAAEADGYVTGLEPGTNYPQNRKDERRAGRLPKLKPGETRRFTLDFGLHSDKTAVDDMEKQVEAIQGGEKPVVEKKPTGG
jgi:hypothetical protein